ncbi:MAG: helix-turn-helix transcriptional regulator [Actinomycetia bacterium]|nr:helix-turn-helix transcriptional regulator [Actinomycetes bacterium]
MSTNRRYNLLCPIARGLDHVGDRWTLLLLRDLHAGPARFTDLQKGLPRLASNLLTDRLRQMEADGLIRRRPAEFGVVVYELTDLGESTGALLFNLAQLGTHFPPDEDVESPGSLRAIAVTLKEALRAVVEESTTITAGLLVDGEAFTIEILDGEVSVRHAQPVDADVTIATEYGPIIAVGDGDLDLETFTKNHVKVVSGDPTKLAELFELLTRAFSLITVNEA